MAAEGVEAIRQHPSRACSRACRQTDLPVVESPARPLKQKEIEHQDPGQGLQSNDGPQQAAASPPDPALLRLPVQSVFRVAGSRSAIVDSYHPVHRAHSLASAAPVRRLLTNIGVSAGEFLRLSGHFLAAYSNGNEFRLAARYNPMKTMRADLPQAEFKRLDACGPDSGADLRSPAGEIRPAEGSRAVSLSVGGNKVETMDGGQGYIRHGFVRKTWPVNGPRADEMASQGSLRRNTNRRSFGPSMKRWHGGRPGRPRRKTA